MTLIELLVVIAIMAMLAAYMLPKLAPMAKERKIREAARSVSVFLDRARSRAIETGRPCGVVFQRVDATNPDDPLANACTMLYQAETPPPYAGDTISARVTVTHISPAALQVNVLAGTIQPGLLRPGDGMQINGQGSWYTITEPDAYNMEGNPVPGGDGFIDINTTSTTSMILSVDPKYQNSLPWPSGGPSAPLPFKILRRPTRTIAQPLTLPVGTAVDLSASGIDQVQNDYGTVEWDQTFSTGQDVVTIMFSPNGTVSRFYWDIRGSNKETDATDPIFLLIGWREQIGLEASNVYSDNAGDVDEESLPNWQVLSNLWIALSPQTGLTSVAENAYPQRIHDLLEEGFSMTWKDRKIKNVCAKALIESRTYARQAQSKGGR